MIKSIKNILVFAIYFLLSMVCHAQKIATSELNGIKWTLVSPVCDYCERGMSFTMDSRTTIEKYKRLNKAFKLPLKYYLSSSIPKKFDSAQIGKNRKGNYIIQYVDDSVFWFKIVEISSTKITLLSKFGITTVYQKVK